MQDTLTLLIEYRKAYAVTHQSSSDATIAVELAACVRGTKSLQFCYLLISM